MSRILIETPKHTVHQCHMLIIIYKELFVHFNLCWRQRLTPRYFVAHFAQQTHSAGASGAPYFCQRFFFVRHYGCWCPATCFATENCQYVEKKFCLASRPDIGAGANPDFNLMTLTVCQKCGTNPNRAGGNQEKCYIFVEF